MFQESPLIMIILFMIIISSMELTKPQCHIPRWGFP